MDVEKIKKMLLESIHAEEARMKQVEARRQAEKDEYDEWERQQDFLKSEGFVGPIEGESEDDTFDEGDIDHDDPESEPDEEDIDEEPEEEADEDAPVDECFTMEDLKLLAGFGQLAPSQITDAEKGKQIKLAEELVKKIGGIKGHHVKNNNKTAVENADYLINLMRTYLDTVKSGGSMKRERRNPYVIKTGGRYGNLTVHLPSLHAFGQLKAFDKGRKVMDAVVDRDTVDMLTKKFNPLRQYSGKAKQIFKRLTQLSGLPENPLSSKFQFV